MVAVGKLLIVVNLDCGLGDRIVGLHYGLDCRLGGGGAGRPECGTGLWTGLWTGGRGGRNVGLDSRRH